MDLERGEVIRRQVEPTEEVHETVLRAVSAATGQPLTELTPLQTAVDVDAMETLLASSEAVRALQFQYMGFEVTVEPDRISLRESDGRDSES